MWSESSMNSTKEDQQARNVPRFASDLNSTGMEPKTPGFLAIVKDPAQTWH